VPNISLLIPSFNSAQTIGATLNSVQSQGKALGRIAGVYIADDCSRDNSISVAEANWTATAIPLHVIKQERNLGQWANVNKTMALLGETADWVLLLHSDDIAKPNWLETMISRMEGCLENVGSICSSWDTLMPDGSIVPGENDPSRLVEVIKGTIEAVQGTLKRGCWWHISGCAIRMRAFFKDVGEFDPALTHLGDWEWLLRCLHKGWEVEYVPRTLILYRQHQRSVSSMSFLHDRDVVESLEIVRHYVQVLSKKDLISLHLRRVTYMVRRFVRAVIELRLQRCLQAAGIMALIWRNLFKCLQGRLS
jgi:glycosyltransferase involved in cell wall biosynthesis